MIAVVGALASLVVFGVVLQMLNFEYPTSLMDAHMTIRNPL